MGISATLKPAGVITLYAANDAASVGKTALEPCMLQLAGVPGIESLEAADGGTSPNGGLPGSDSAADMSTATCAEKQQS